MEKPLIFISHITSEKKLGLALKKSIEKAFLGMTDVFISSDPENLPAGKQWYKTIMEKLDEASILFVLMSPQAIKKPWISYEAGAASIRDIPMIPVCHSGITLNNLPAPFSFHQAVEACNLESLQLIIPTISTSLGSSRPPIDFSEFVVEIEKHTQESQFLESKGIEVNDIQIDTIPDYAKECLYSIANVKTDDGVTFRELNEHMNLKSYSTLATNVALKILERAGLIINYDTPHPDVFTEYTVSDLTQSGWDFIEKNLRSEQLLAKQRIANNKLDHFYDSNPLEGIPF